MNIDEAIRIKLRRAYASVGVVDDATAQEPLELIDDLQDDEREEYLLNRRQRRRIARAARRGAK